MKQLGLNVKGTAGGIIGALLAIGFYALFVLQLVGLGFLTKFVFSAQSVDNTHYCIKLPSKTERNLMKLSVIMGWISAGATVILLVLAILGAIFLRNGSKQEIKSSLSTINNVSQATLGSASISGGITLLLAALAIQVVTIIGWVHLTKVAFKGKEVGNSAFCVNLTKKELAWSKTAVILSWVSTGTILASR